MNYVKVNIDDVITFTYTNYKGVTSTRKAIVKEFVFGSNEWHPEPQLLMNGFDLDKSELRLFAVKDIIDIKVNNQ